MSQDWHNNPDQVGRRMFPSQCKWHFLWLFVYLLYTTITFCVPSLIDCHCISFFTINRTAERKMYLKDNTFLVETFQKRMNEMEFGSKIVLTYCETKIVLVIEKIFFKLFTLSLAYLKSFSWFLKQFFKQWWKASKPA